MPPTLGDGNLTQQASKSHTEGYVGTDYPLLSAHERADRSVLPRRWHVGQYPGQVDAFVYSYTYVGGLGMYNYHCLCQQCGEHIKDQSGNEAITWCKFHNRVCAS